MFADAENDDATIDVVAPSCAACHDVIGNVAEGRAEMEAAEREDSSLQACRIEEVADRIRELGARSVLDLGCGEGELLTRLAALPDIGRIIGVDRDPEATEAARAALSALAAAERDRVDVLTASFLDDRLGVGGRVDTITLVEVIEHIDPRWLSALESRVFGGAGGFDARFVLVSTPNADYNPIYGLAPGEFRHPDHRFEWGRRRFRAWAQRIGGDYGYRWAVSGIGSDDPVLGQPTQLAVFEKLVVRWAQA